MRSGHSSPGGSRYSTGAAIGGRRCPRNFGTTVDSYGQVGYAALFQVESAVIITILILGIFVADLIMRWWRENEWRRKWRQRDDD